MFIFRFSYEPEPDAEEELCIQAGDYLLVWGDPVGPGGYLDAELLDGRRGLVPSHFVQRLIGNVFYLNAKQLNLVFINAYINFKY